MTTVSFKHLLHLRNETKWSDLLATLMENDRPSTARWLGIPVDAIARIQREVVDPLGKPDIKVFDAHGRVTAVIEVKLLSGLGPAQLERYAADACDAVENCQFRVVNPGPFPLNINSPGWYENSWDETLSYFADSDVEWVRQTAVGMGELLKSSLPTVHGGVQWSALTPGSDFRLGIRTRISWLYRNLHPQEGGSLNLVGSSASDAWIVNYEIPIDHPLGEYSIYLELEEYLPRKQGWPKTVESDGTLPRGPLILMGLKLRSYSSEQFDWELLHLLWDGVLKDCGLNFETRSANPKTSHDRAAWMKRKELNMPKHVGRGFGHNQSKKYGFCVFGVHLPIPDASLDEIAQTAQSALDVMHQMSNFAVQFLDSKRP